MSEDLSNEIKELLDRSQSKKEDEKGDQGASAGITMGDIVGNSGTVVIGGNVNQGRREEDRPGAGDGSHGRRASDRALHQEVRSLRQQVQALKQMITELYERCTVNAFKQPAPCQAPCRATTGTPAPSTANVANRHTPASDARHDAKARTTRGFSAPQPTPAHINPFVSFLLAPNTGPRAWRRRPSGRSGAPGHGRSPKSRIAPMSVFCRRCCAGARAASRRRHCGRPISAEPAKTHGRPSSVPVTVSCIAVMAC